MFNWSVKTGWDEVWIPAIRNYQEEMVFYEILSKVGPDDQREEVVGGSREPGVASNPLNVEE